MLKRKLGLFIFILSGLLLINISNIRAYQATELLHNARNFGTTAYSDENIEPVSYTVVIAQILKFALSLLGVVFVVLIIHAGYLWMLAGDKSDQIDAAKTKIKNATIGLIIIIMAYALTYFVIEKLVEETLGRF